MKRLDKYIFWKFLSTYFYAIALLLAIVVCFDVSEKVDDFLEYKAPFKLILTDYYLNFIPYFANLFSSLFVFIAVIFFTSKMAYSTEIVAMLSSGLSFRRILYPYFLGALVIASFNFVLGYYVIPEANKGRLEFQSQYLKGIHSSGEKNVHKQIEPGLYAYLGSFSIDRQTGYTFTLESIKDDELKSRLTADRIVWDTTRNIWQLEQYLIRRFENGNEVVEIGTKKDTVLSVGPEDFTRKNEVVSSMTHKELDEYIQTQTIRGTSDVIASLIEKHKRIAYPFSTFILTFLGVILSSKKVRGGIGLQIGLGILLCFTYVLFMQFTDTFALSGALPAGIAVWIPNIIYSIIGLLLLRVAPK